MKRILFLLVLFLTCLTFDVFAQDYEVNDLIPVNQMATVDTEIFTYQNFTYNYDADSSGNVLITFDSIFNKTYDKIPVSINILLFDKNKKNIGDIVYCTEKDLSSEFADFKLGSREFSSLAIKVTSKYFGEGYSSSDVKYISVLNENKYCHVGGYTNYIGLTIEQIKAKNTTTSSLRMIIVEKVMSYLQNSFIVFLIIFLIISIVLYLIYAHVINKLYKRMYNKSTGLGYIPVVNQYISVELSFGKIVARIYIVLFLLGFWLFYAGISFLFVLIDIIGTIAFLINIVKLITKKYELFYFNPTVDSNSLKNILKNKNNNISSDNKYVNIDEEVEQPIDLSYNNVKVSSLNDDDNFSISQGEAKKSLLDDDVDESNKDNKEGSDLSKFFK